ncbi:acyl-CoA dehydrogenase [Flagellimonas profundi]|uniref:Acyl-CoA dehydrogenase n=1 Tax=Flagellimonas profundi TaxID=2915620 RepID=A0ABS3FAL6_9FLAO|nr:acyl-CoA dehydrogenase [Allomuricauda profundi]MBO0340203.1 acyl-CoA dehydrogenase [Allomuricauda profundi]
MKGIKHMHEIGELCFGKEVLPKEVLQWIAQENLWNLWVPKSHGGLEMSLADGLDTLRSLAQLDGSLGWTVTLCSGANFFIGNLPKEAGHELFNGNNRPVFGGSGGVFGTADKVGNGYVINGTWKYATGAPYLTHFTLNAKIREDGADVLMDDGTPLVRSFLLKREQVDIIQDWNTMGLKATATHSFEVNSQWVDGNYSFVYDTFYLSQPIFKVPFSVFADLTLWVNYIGMAEHFLEEAKKSTKTNISLDRLLACITRAKYYVSDYSKKIETLLAKGHQIPDGLIRGIHQEAAGSVQSISETIIGAYSTLGIRASTEGVPLNQIFKDYFTATQHHIFSPSGRRNQL